MRRNARAPSRPREGGFTLLEALVGLAVLSLLGIGAWSAVTVAWRSVARFHDSAKAGALVLRIDDRFRECAARVRPAWWGREPGIEVTGHAWRIAGLDGDPARALTVSWQEGVLSIDDGVSVARYRGFSSVELSPARDDAGIPYGARLTLDAEHFGQTTIVARYGGRPVRHGGT